MDRTPLVDWPGTPRPAGLVGRGSHKNEIKGARGKKSSGSRDRFVAFVSLGLGAVGPIIAYCNYCTNDVHLHALDFYCQQRVCASARLSSWFSSVNICAAIGRRLSSLRYREFVLNISGQVRCTIGVDRAEVVPINYAALTGN